MRINIRNERRNMRNIILIIVLRNMLRNKDHKRMMVNLMLMIVQNLKYFIIDVTPSAVASTVVIL